LFKKKPIVWVDEPLHAQIAGKLWPDWQSLLASVLLHDYLPIRLERGWDKPFTDHGIGSDGVRRLHLRKDFEGRYTEVYLSPFVTEVFDGCSAYAVLVADPVRLADGTFDWAGAAATANNFSEFMKAEWGHLPEPDVHDPEWYRVLRDRFPHRSRLVTAWQMWRIRRSLSKLAKTVDKLTREGKL
jgi:hypothetical protein